jgi:hypothetical protein
MGAELSKVKKEELQNNKIGKAGFEGYFGMSMNDYLLRTDLLLAGNELLFYYNIIYDTILYCTIRYYIYCLYVSLKRIILYYTILYYVMKR